MQEFRHKIICRAFVILIGLNMTFSGCATSIGLLPVYTGEPDKFQVNGHGGTVVNVQYLGVGGYLIRYGKNALMTAPSITNPGLLKIISMTRLKTNGALVDRLLPPVEDVETILVGHSHYDHLLDVPYVMQKRAKKAIVYGSKTMGHIMAAVVDKSRIMVVDPYAATGRTPGQWIYNQNRTVRFMAIQSEHAPHFAGIKLLPVGPYDKDLKCLPRTVFGWVEGQTYAYLIDFLDGQGGIAFRIHYQDAASTPPLGFVPDLPANDQKRVDIAILCVASFTQVKEYPEGIIREIRPKNIILGHWEDFFRNQKRPVKVSRTTNVRNFIKRLEFVMPGDSQWFLPEPFTQMRFPVIEKN
ncbi:MAG: hypothetical protein ACK41Q_08815 [Candidatus Brocadia sp.]